MSPGDGDDPGIPGTLPPLAGPIGPLGHRLQQSTRVTDRGFRLAGRRAVVVGREDRGIAELWTHPLCLARALRVEGAEARAVTRTPLGLERYLAVGDAAVIERVVVSRDAPVCWVEWSADRTLELELGWRVEGDWRPDDVAESEARPGPDPDAGPHPARPERGLTFAARGRGTGHRSVFALSRAPEELQVDPGSAVDPGAPEPSPTGPWVVRARVRVPGDDGADSGADAGAGAPGLRLAVVGASPEDDPGRLLRVAGRAREAVRAREAAAERMLAERLTVARPAGLGRALEWSLLRLEAARVEWPGAGSWLADGAPRSTEGPASWVIDDAARIALGLLASGDFDGVRTFLTSLARHADDGRIPARGTGPAELRYDGAASRLFLLLVARYLAWSGDRAGVRALWPSVRAAVTACRPGPPAELAVAAEELGEGALAVELADAAGGDALFPAPGADAWVAPGRASVLPDRATEAARQVDGFVRGALGAEPMATRGRLVLRPRLPADWSELRVRNLAVGPASVDLEYQKEDGHHRLTLRQSRGAAPLRVVLEPELPGQKIAGTRVDGVAAELDAARVADRWRVPVQLVLDEARVLEVQFAGSGEELADPGA